MGALIIVSFKIIVEILLELIQIYIQFLPEGDPVEMVQDCLVERYADSIRGGFSFASIILHLSLRDSSLRTST